MDPATWIYLALLAASTASSYQAQRKTDKARAGVAREERIRRKEQQQDAEAAAQRTQEEYFNARNKEEEREAELAQQFQAGPEPAPTTDAAGTRFLSTDAPTQSTRTVQATQAENAKGRARSQQRATSMAQLGAFGDVFRDAGMAAGRNAQDIGLSASKMRGWQQNVLPALYAHANTAGRDWATAADVMKLAATVMSFGALGGADAAAKAGTEATTTTGVLDQMSGVPAEFAGKDLFGMGAMGGQGFAPMSALETASIGEAANKLQWMDYADLGITPQNYMQDFVQPNVDEYNRYMQLFDPYWKMFGGGRRPKFLPVEF